MLFLYMRHIAHIFTFFFFFMTCFNSGFFCHLVTFQTGTMFTTVSCWFIFLPTFMSQYVSTLHREFETHFLDRCI